ncbi:MAG: A24 family peptidase [Sphingobium sp.]
MSEAVIGPLPGPGLAIGAGFIFGLIFGSFLGALVLRWPEGRSVLSGRSHCDGCGRTLGAGELIPLLSALMSRGRCRTCGARIDPLHGRMELGCGLIGAIAMALVPLPWALGWMALGWILLALAVLDARHFWLPDGLTVSLAFLGLTIGPWMTGVRWEDALIGAAAGYGILLVVAVGYKKARGREGLGLGDAKLLGALGAWFGWQALPFILLGASSLALVWTAVRTLGGAQIDGGTKIALGTFLCIAAVPAGIAARMLLFSGG